jgi:hypothetical protein
MSTGLSRDNDRNMMMMMIIIIIIIIIPTATTTIKLPVCLIKHTGMWGSGGIALLIFKYGTTCR